MLTLMLMRERDSALNRRNNRYLPTLSPALPPDVLGWGGPRTPALPWTSKSLSEPARRGDSASRSPALNVFPPTFSCQRSQSLRTPLERLRERIWCIRWGR